MHFDVVVAVVPAAVVERVQHVEQNYFVGVLVVVVPVVVLVAGVVDVTFLVADDTTHNSAYFDDAGATADDMLLNLLEYNSFEQVDLKNGR